MTNKQIDLAENVLNYVRALCYTHHVEQLELMGLAGECLLAEHRRLQALDPNRNK